jgi:hypothetical protein
MTRQKLVTIILVVVGIFVLWYMYQEYKQYHNGFKFFIEAE